MTYTAVTFHLAGDDTQLGDRVELPEHRPCTVAFPVPADWADRVTVYAQYWEGDDPAGRAVNASVQAGDTFDVTIDPPRLAPDYDEWLRDLLATTDGIEAL